MKCLRPLGLLVASILSASCATYRASDFSIFVQLPASKDCAELFVMSGKEKRYPPDECKKKMERAVFLSSESWKLLRGDVQSNCQFASCKQITGAADGLFLSIDRALQMRGK